MPEEIEVPFFQKTAPKTFTWAVRVPVPADNGYVYARFVGVFKYLPSDEIDAWLVRDGKPRRDSELAAEILLGVNELKGEDGQVLRSSPELVTKVLAVDRTASAVVATFIAVSRGVAAEKN